MKKYIVYFEDWHGIDEWAVFDKEEDAEEYMRRHEEEDFFSPEEGLFIAEEER